MVIVFSVVLVVCQALIFVLPLLYKTPPLVNFFPLAALAILWLNQWLFLGKKGWGVFSVVLWILFGFFGIMALMATVFTGFII